MTVECPQAWPFLCFGEWDHTRPTQGDTARVGAQVSEAPPAGRRPLPAYASPSARLHSAERLRRAEFSGRPAADAPAAKRVWLPRGRGLGCPHSPALLGSPGSPHCLCPPGSAYSRPLLHPAPAHRHHHTLRRQNQAHPHHLHRPSANASSPPYASMGSTDTADIGTIPHTAFNMDCAASTCLSGPQNHALRREALRPVPQLRSPQPT